MRKSAPLFCALLLSLSARRAWIEIYVGWLFTSGTQSLSARRAWIEMLIMSANGRCRAWSLSARRAWIEIPFRSFVQFRKHSRSPQGERG